GPEAGVWVIAETHDLRTRMARIVVTDDAGRYLVPDLPPASYSVWVRGYGLVDSPKSTTRPGTTLDLRAVPAPTPRAAAEYYPAGRESRGTAPEGNGISPGLRHQAQWLRMMKSGGCTACHQLGTVGTRELHPALGSHPSSVEAGARRIMSGQAGGNMVSGMANF